MATKLFLRNTTTNSITDTGDGILYDLSTTAGASLDTATTNTTGSGTEIQATKTAGGSTIAWISGRAPSGGFTLTSTDISIWQLESATQANIGGRYRVFKRAANGTITELGGGPFDDGIEMSTTIREDTWPGNVTDTAFAEDDRILIRYYLTNIGTMGASRTGTMNWNAADASTGDSFLNIAETVTFKLNDIIIALTGSAATGSVGTLGVSHAQPLTGASATSAVGTVTPSTGGSTLFNGCVAAWKLSDLTDATGRGNTLTNNNSATFNTGKIGNAAYLAASSSQYLSKSTSADVELGDIDFTIALWAYTSSFTSTKHIALGKDVSGQREYYLYAEDQGGGAGNYRYSFAVFAGGVEKVVVANTFGNISTAAWNCIIVWWNAVAQTLNISINDGTTDTNSVGLDLDAAGTAQFRIGARQFSGFENYWDGRIDAVHIWKRVLTSGERTEFYNSGAGVEFSAGSPDVSVALTGVSVTSTAGSLAQTRSTPLSGGGAAASTGSLSPDRSVSVLGASATSSSGSVISSQSIGLSGVGASTSIGTLNPTRTVSISGNLATSAAGTVTPGISSSAALTGVSATATVGVLSPSLTKPLVGSAATSAVGTVTPVVGVTVALTGVSATTSTGTVTPSRSTPLTGVSATTTTGIVTPSTGVFVALTGVQANASTGTLSTTTSKGLTGQSGATSIGALTSQRSVSLSGVSVTSTAGSPTTSLTVSITGVNVAATVGVLSALSGDMLAVSTHVASVVLFTAHVAAGTLRTSDTSTMTLVTTNTGTATVVYQHTRSDS